MANNNYDYLVRLGVDQSEINRVIANLDAAFGKQYKLKVDTSDLSEVSQVLSNLTKAMDSVKTSLPEVSKSQEKTADTTEKAGSQSGFGLENIAESINASVDTVKKTAKQIKELQDAKNTLSGVS